MKTRTLVIFSALALTLQASSADVGMVLTDVPIGWGPAGKTETPIGKTIFWVHSDGKNVFIRQCKGSPVISDVQAIRKNCTPANNPFGDSEISVADFTSLIIRTETHDGKSPQHAKLYASAVMAQIEDHHHLFPSDGGHKLGASLNHANELDSDAVFFAQGEGLNIVLKNNSSDTDPTRQPSSTKSIDEMKVTKEGNQPGTPVRDTIIKAGNPDGTFPKDIIQE